MGAKGDYSSRLWSPKSWKTCLLGAHLSLPKVFPRT